MAATPGDGPTGSPADRDPDPVPEGTDDDGPVYPWLPPEDRIWRHPSEAARAGTAPAVAGRRSAPSRPAGATPVLATVALAGGLVGAAVTVGAGWASGFWSNRTTVIQTAAPATTGVSLSGTGSGGEGSGWAAVEDSVAPSVVGITVQSDTGPVQGSGLLMSVTGPGEAFVVTDRSLFSDGRATGYVGSVEVSYLTGVAEKARIVDEDRRTGLAVLAVADPARETPPATGTAADLRVADPVLIVGARSMPGGWVSPATVSAEDRQVDLTDGTDMDGLLSLNMASMAPAATGGPVLDGYGRVVGVTVAVEVAGGSDGGSRFAVPIDVASRVVDRVVAGKPVTHPWVGIDDAEELPPVTAHQFGLTGGVQAGVVDPDGPAGRAGMHSSDILTSFAGQPLASVGELVSTLSALEPGETVPIVFLHDGRQVEGHLTVSEQPLGD